MSCTDNRLTTICCVSRQFIERQIFILTTVSLTECGSNTTHTQVSSDMMGASHSACHLCLKSSNDDNNDCPATGHNQIVGWSLLKAAHALWSMFTVQLMANLHQSCFKSLPITHPPSKGLVGFLLPGLWPHLHHTSPSSQDASPTP